MKPVQTSKNERERLSTLRAMRILDTPKEERFDRITRLATKLFSVPISTITLVDIDREWHKSYQGLTKRQAHRAISFCSHTIDFDKPLIIFDTKKDKRFYNNPMVTKKPYIRFYAGIPLKGPDGRNVGAFCIKDTKSRKLNRNEIELLKGLASWAELELDAKELSKSTLNLKFIRWYLTNQSNKLQKALGKIRKIEAVSRKYYKKK